MYEGNGSELKADQYCVVKLAVTTEFTTLQQLLRSGECQERSQSEEWPGWTNGQLQNIMPPAQAITSAEA